MLWLALGCSLFPSAPKPAPPAFRGATLTLATLGLELRVDQPPSVHPRADGGVALAFSRGRELTLSPPKPGGLLPEVADLAPDVQLHYALDRAAGGMGGPESHLRGTVAAGDATWDVQCVDQVEQGTPDARWCLEVLATLRPWRAP